jgi:hypothetical protein
MSIQDDIDALAAMAMTCFDDHRFGVSEKNSNLPKSTGF